MFKRCLLYIGIFFWYCCCHAADAVHLTSEDSSKFNEVIGIIKKEYISDIGEKNLVESGLEGIMKSLDPYSSYMNKDFFNEMSLYNEGSFVGIGLELTFQEGNIIVVSSIYGSPAFSSKINTGDLLLEVNHKSVRGKSINEVVNEIRGVPGTKVSLRLMDHKLKKDYKVETFRKKIRIDTVESATMNGNILYIRLTCFAENTSVQLANILKKNRKLMKGVILDLRNNPGGLLDQSVEVASIFLNEGVVLKTIGRNEKKVFNVVKGGYKVIDVPMIVIINEGSASGAEIVAAALKDNGRSMLIGEKTFGKGSVQSIIPLKDGSGISLTTALYYRPSGGIIEKNGVVPDITLDQNYALSKFYSNGSRESEVNKPFDFVSFLKKNSKETDDPQIFIAGDLLKKMIAKGDGR